MFMMVLIIFGLLLLFILVILLVSNLDTFGVDEYRQATGKKKPRIVSARRLQPIVNGMKKSYDMEVARTIDKKLLNDEF